MSKGTKVYPVRLDPGLMEDVEITIERRNMMTREAPWTLSDFLRIAIREKIRKMERCRRPRSR
jgi:hypothetical protein